MGKCQKLSPFFMIQRRVWIQNPSDDGSTFEPPKVIRNHQQERFDSGQLVVCGKWSDVMDSLQIGGFQDIREPLIDFLNATAEVQLFHVAAGYCVRDLRIEIAPDHATDCDQHHAPVADCNDATQLESSMKSNKYWARDPKKNVELQPTA